MSEHCSHGDSETMDYTQIRFTGNVEERRRAADERIDARTSPLDRLVRESAIIDAVKKGNGGGEGQSSGQL